MILSVFNFLCQFWLFLGIVVAVVFTAFVMVWLILAVVHVAGFVVRRFF